MEHLLRNHQQQVVAHGNPDLRIDFISRCSVERLYMLASLYELEEIMYSFSKFLKGCKGYLVSAQALLGCELGETHHHELVTTGVFDLVTVAFVSCDTLAKDVL